MSKRLFGGQRQKRYFLLPNDLFRLGLTASEIAIYAYLMRCENRETYQCRASYQTIGNAVNLSRNTVMKYVRALEEKCLIFTEHTSYVTTSGLPSNGSLLFTIRPISDAVEHYQAKLMEGNEMEFIKSEQLALQRQHETAGDAV